MSKQRKLEQLKAWAKLAAADPLLVGIASSANSPTQAYELAYIETGDAKKAKSCRWLAVMKRDHGRRTFDDFVSSVVSDSPRQTSTGKRKEASPMSTTSKKVKEAKKPLIPLRHISFRAAVNGAFARVRCVQEFGNDADHPVEAVYVFPMPDDATVTGCTMDIGNRRVEAVLKKREEARREYDQAVAAGHHGVLLEQERPNIFTMNVGGIEPGEKISVQVDYVQRIPWQAGGGRFTVKLVVPPQFITGTPAGKQAGGWAEDTDAVPDASRITPPVSPDGVPYNADISVSFSPGFRCELACPSHETIIPKQVVAKADTVELKTGDILTDRDFILAYRSLSRVPEVAVHAGSFGTGDGQENFLLTSIIPPGDEVVVGSDIVFVLDCSGSMDGPKIEGLKVIARKVLANLIDQKAGYRVGIIAFGSKYEVVQPLADVNASMDAAFDRLGDMGGTELAPALTAAHSMLSGKGIRPCNILLVTDGETTSLNYVGSGARIIAVGIDTAVNDTVVRELARRTNGVSEFIRPGEDYGTIANRMAGYLSGPVLRDVKVQTSGDVVGVSDVFKGRPATIGIRFQGKPEKVVISGDSGAGGNRPFWDVEAAGAKECDFAPQIWARERIRESDDENVQVEASLKYGVICQHTSFVAVSLKEVPGQKPERVEIPVSLPEGWNWDTVFGGAAHLRAGAAGADICCFMEATLDACVEGFDETLGAPAARTRGPGVLGHILSRFTGKGGTPVLPATPQPTTPKAGRFTLNAADLVDRLIAILIAILGNNRKGAEKAFADIMAGLTTGAVKGMDEVERCMASYFALRLSKHGLKLDGGVMAALLVEPKDKTHTAFAWHNLALKEAGRPYVGVVPFDAEVAGYIAWRLGSGPKPDTGDWSLVP